MPHQPNNEPKTLQAARRNVRGALTALGACDLCSVTSPRPRTKATQGGGSDLAGRGPDIADQAAVLIEGVLQVGDAP